MDAGTPQAFYANIPPVTKFFVTSYFLCAMGLALGMLEGSSIVFIPSLIASKFQIWRLLTPFLCIGGFSMGFLFMIYFAYSYGARLETDPYPLTPGQPVGGTADYAFCVIFGMITILLETLAVHQLILGPSLVYYIVYIWSKRNPDTPVSFMFGLRFNGFYVPFLFLALDFCMGASIIPHVVGIVAGHIFYFIVDVMPLQFGQKYIHTPNFLVNWLEGGEVQQANPVEVRHAWGNEGHVLGRS